MITAYPGAYAHQGGGHASRYGQPSKRRGAPYEERQFDKAGNRH
jgi:hypothetical protein